MINKYPFLFDLNTEKTLKAFQFLKNYDYSSISKTFRGNHATNFFFQYYRFNTKFKTRKHSNISAWDDTSERNKILNTIITKKTFRKNLSLAQKIRSYFQLYYAPILQFKPIVAAYIYNKYKPTTIMDFCAGWGDRLMGAMVHNIDYIGIDTNTDLQEPYKKMIDFFEPYTTTKATILFQKAEDTNFSNYDYDFVLTSPPFYIKEKYNNMPQYENEEEWIKHFLIYTIKKCFKNLKKNGIMGLHLPHKYFVKVHDVMGDIYDKIEYPKQRKNTKYHNNRQADHYIEYIYFWKKL